MRPTCSNSGSNATSYRDDGVSPEQSYVYRVKAVNGHGTSGQSNYVRADTPAAPASAKLQAGNGVRQAPPDTESTDADLSALSLSAGTLVPTFHRVTTSYAVSVEHSALTITVTATARGVGATGARVQHRIAGAAARERVRLASRPISRAALMRAQRLDLRLHE